MPAFDMHAQPKSRTLKLGPEARFCLSIESLLGSLICEEGNASVVANMCFCILSLRGCRKANGVPAFTMWHLDLLVFNFSIPLYC